MPRKIFYKLFCSHIDVKLYFHGPDQYADSSGRMGYKLYLGEEMQSQIRIRDISMLDRDALEEREDDKNRVIEGMDLSGDIVKKHNKTCSNEPFDVCLYTTLIRAMQENTEGNCTVPFITGSERAKICTEYNDVNTTFWIRHFRITNQQKDCNTPCRTVTAELGAKNYKRYAIADQKYSQLDLYFSPRAIQTTEHFLYTFLIFISEVGGYVSLILGYSLFELIQLICRTIEVKMNRVVSTTVGKNSIKHNNNNK